MTSSTGTRRAFPFASVWSTTANAEDGKPDDFRSVERQRAAIEAFVDARGWTLAREHCYVDDGIGGAEFGEWRPALARLLNALKPRPPFAVALVHRMDGLAARCSRCRICSGDSPGRA